MEESKKERCEKLTKMYKQLGNYAFVLTRDVERANDLLQDTSLKIINGDGKYKEVGRFDKWAKTVMKFTFLNDVRSKENNMERFVDGYDYYRDEKIHPYAAENEAPYTTNELQRALGMLPEIQYRILLMRGNGYKYEEIAKELEMPVGTVKSKIHLAKINLRNIMDTLL